MKKLSFGKRNIEYYMMSAYREDGIDLDEISNHIVNHYKSTYVTENDEKLLNLFFKQDIAQEDLDKFLEDWDIEREGGQKALMLSYFMKNHPELKYSSYIEPRLNGILKYYRFKNLNYVSHYKKVCTAVKNADIDILILKGGAFRHYNPEFPRVMGDIDFLVRNDYEKAKNIALGFGYKYKEYKHSMDLHDPVTNMNLLDIHKMLDLQTDSAELINEDLFKRASLEKVFGLNDVYVPCPEDMMFLLLVNLNKNLMRNTSIHNILHSIIDSMYLIHLKPDFDWNIVKQNAIKTKTEPQLAVIIKFLNEFVPEKLPEMFEKEFLDRCILHIYNKWYLKRLKKKSQTLFIDILKKIWKNIIYYFKFRYLYIKYKQKSVRENAELAKSILENQKLLRKNDRK